MFYIPSRNLAFLHIPKNAGKAVKKALMAAADISYASFARDLDINEEQAEQMLEIGVHFPDIGRVQPEHMTLQYLESHFPESWEVFCRSRSFVLARAPRDRFFSALIQRLREYRGAVAIRVDDPIVIEEAKIVCDFLDGRSQFADREFIHFGRQRDFVDLRGERMVSAVFPVERTDLAVQWIKQETGLVIDIDQDHVRREPKVWARSLQPAARVVGRRLMPSFLKKALYSTWTKSAMFADASGRYQSTTLGDDVERFIAEYYADDATLYEEACVAAQLGTGEPGGAAKQ